MLSASVISPNIDVSNFDRSYFTGFAPKRSGKSLSSSGPLVIVLLNCFSRDLISPLTLPGMIISSKSLTSPILLSIMSVVKSAATFTFKFLISYENFLSSILSITVLSPFSANFPVMNNIFFIESAS